MEELVFHEATLVGLAGDEDGVVDGAGVRHYLK